MVGCWPVGRVSCGRFTLERHAEVRQGLMRRPGSSLEFAVVRDLLQRRVSLPRTLRAGQRAGAAAPLPPDVCSVRRILALGPTS